MHGSISPSQLLTFSSDNTAALTVSDEGIVALAGNFHDSVDLTAADKCGSGNSDVQAEFANLYPEVYDVDLGSSTKAPLGFIDVGDSIDVDVRIRASSSFALTVFQITVTFDATIVQVLVLHEQSTQHPRGHRHLELEDIALGRGPPKGHLAVW